MEFYQLCNYSMRLKYQLVELAQIFNDLVELYQILNYLVIVELDLYFVVLLYLQLRYNISSENLSSQYLYTFSQQVPVWDLQ